MKYQPHHTAISVRNLDKSLEFYKMLGYGWVHRYDEPDGLMSIVHLKLGSWDAALKLWHDLQTHLPDAAGSTKSHHAWKGGYKDHVQEAMNLARIPYAQLDSERPLPFTLSSAYLVLFLHDCEKPFRHATDEQLAHFPWISGRPRKSDKDFQKRLIAEYGFTISDGEWNALAYVEGEPDAEYK